MGNRFILLILLMNLAGCGAFRPASGKSDNLSSESQSTSSGKHSSVSFIEDISTETSVKSTDTHVSFAGTSAKPSTTAIDNTRVEQLQFKYAILTNSPVEEMTNQRLLVFMDQWYGAPYHYGGNNRDGIDCSAFSCQLMSNVYDVNRLPRMSSEQYKVTKRVPKKDLKEGDLVFFHTLGKGHKVTHVGVYLYNNRFVHASINGVQISDLGEGYYLHHYVGAGRAIDNDKTY